MQDNDSRWDFSGGARSTNTDDAETPGAGPDTTCLISTRWRPDVNTKSAVFVSRASGTSAGASRTSVQQGLNSGLTGFDIWREILIKALSVLMHSVSLNKDNLHNYQTVKPENTAGKLLGIVARPLFVSRKPERQRQTRRPVTDHGEVVTRLVHPAPLCATLQIHPDSPSKVNCARTSRTALSDPGAKPDAIGRSCVRPPQMCSALNISRRRGDQKKKKRKGR